MSIEDKRKELQEVFPEYEGIQTMSKNVLEYIHMRVMEPGMSFLGLEIDLERTVNSSRAKKKAHLTEVR